MYSAPPRAGCNGEGHVRGMYAMHYAVSGCPIAARNRLANAQNKVHIMTTCKPIYNTPSLCVFLSNHLRGLPLAKALPLSWPHPHPPVSPTPGNLSKSQSSPSCGVVDGLENSPPPQTPPPLPLPMMMPLNLLHQSHHCPQNGGKLAPLWCV